MKNDQLFAVRMNAEMLANLNKIAAITKMSKSSITREAVQLLAERPDLLQAKLRQRIDTLSANA